ncbi:MAG: hypothetical protein PHC75_01895 [Burkholderiales bacterium]|nr:hypothetical protein [Burkholderiales bacterium]
MNYNKLFLTMIVAISLSSCNSGAKYTQVHDPLNYKEFTVSYDSKITEEFQSIDLNLYNSIFISPNKQYFYKITDQAGNLVGGNAFGGFTCKTLGECLISGVLIKKDHSYLISIYDSNNILIGGDVLYVTNYITYLDIIIDEASTANYISQKIQQNLNTDFSISQIETRLFKDALSYKTNIQMSDMIYTYYNFLKEKSNNSIDPIITMANQYKKCANESICNLEPSFIKNEKAVMDAINSTNSVVEKYAKDKNDAALYASYKWYKENIKDKFPVFKDVISMGVNIFFPGGGEKLVSAAGEVFSVIDKTFNMSGIDNSKIAYTRLELFNNNLSKYYVAATPNYYEIISQMSSELLSLQIRRDFSLNSSYVLSTKNIVNNNLRNLDIVSYISNMENENKHDVEWITKVWSLENVLSRKANNEYISDRQNIVALSKAYKQIILTDRDSGVNNILSRKYYNQLLISNMLDGIETLQSAMYLDAISIMLRDKEDLSSKKMIYPTQIVVATINLSGDYNTDMSRLSNYYRIRFNNLKNAYQSVILPEKEWVSDNVMQNLQVEGKCNIDDTDGLNYITATCPYYYQELEVSKVKYITSRLDKSNSKCFTINKDASGDITKVADIRNIGGILQCMNAFPFGSDPLDTSNHLVATSVTSINKLNNWYIENEKYFDGKLSKKDTNMRYIFLPAPDKSEFKFQSSGKQQFVSNQLNFNDTNVDSINKAGNIFSPARNYAIFSTFIRDNNENLIAGISVNNITMIRLLENDIHGIAIKSLYGNSDYKDIEYVYGHGFIEFNSQLDKNYRVDIFGMSSINSNNENLVDWVFKGIIAGEIR